MDDTQESLAAQETMRKLKVQKENLEAQIQAKSAQLKKLCIEEAELTGIIPMEIPLDEDESPPKIRRRVGTMYPYSEDILSRLITGHAQTEERREKRKIPLASWSKNSLSSPPHYTWSPQSQNVSPKKKPATRSFTYVHKLKIIKKW